MFEKVFVTAENKARLIRMKKELGLKSVDEVVNHLAELEECRRRCETPVEPKEDKI
jgi:hypothetical protein